MGFSLKPLHCTDPVLSLLRAICAVGHFSAENAHANYSIYYVVALRVGTLVHSFYMYALRGVLTSVLQESQGLTLLLYCYRYTC